MSALRVRWGRPVAVGLVAGGMLFFGYIFLVGAPTVRTFGFDAFAYWDVSMPDPYGVRVGVFGAFNYSPPAALVADWFGALDWTTFIFLWTMLIIGTVVWIAGSPTWILIAFAFPFVALELYHGNINILIAATIVLGFSHPWTWSFVLLTKTSAGVGLLWFAVRREWRPLSVALGTTAVICAISFLIAPGLWGAWIDIVLYDASLPPRLASIPVPLWVRLPAAVIIVVWGALTDRRWTVVVSAMLAMPVFWYLTPAILVGVIPDIRARIDERKRAGAAIDHADPAQPLPARRFEASPQASTVSTRGTRRNVGT